MLSLVTKGVDQAIRAVEKDAKQARFAGAVALTRTARLGVEAAQDQARKDLDNPTPFTLRGFRYRRATKANLEAAVYIPELQTDYLQWSIYGGRRPGRAKSGEAVPVNIRLNQYGNIPGRARGRVLELIKQPDTFIGTVRGIYGVWQRGHISRAGRFSRARKSRASNIRLLIRFEPYVKYQKRFRFFEAGERTFAARFDDEYTKAYDEAIRTAR